jgi:hypothetical protein
VRSLRDLQLAFAESVLGEADASLAGRIRGRGLSGRRRLQVYRNNTFASLTEALAAVYPVVKKLVGEEFFGYAARCYVPLHPSRSGNLHDFGAHWALFLQGFGPAAGLPYLPDVARLEWAYHRVFHEASHAPLDLASLSAVAPELYGTLRFRLHPATRLLQSQYPILRIWQVNQDGYAGDPAVDLAEGAARILVSRPHLEVELEALGEAEFTLLRAVASGRTLGEACEAAMEVQPEFDLGACLQHRLLRGTLVEFLGSESAASSEAPALGNGGET